MGTIQRWERPLDFPPGHWKKQLPTKYLAIAARGDLPALKQLIAEQPEFLSKRGAHNRTFLWEATRKGRLETVKWLVERGAEINATGSYNGECYVQITPYCAAIYYHRPAIAAYLQQQNPQPDIFRAAFLGDLSAIEHHLVIDPTLLNAEDPHDNIYYTPVLSFAVAGGHLPMLDYLLKQDADVPQYSGQLFSLAARNTRMDMIELLVAYGAEVSPTDTGIFVDSSDLSIPRYLLDHGASATRAGKNGFPPLIFVVRGDKGEHPDIAQLLLDYGADVNAIGPKGRTALHYAAKAGFTKIVKLLLDGGANRWLLDDDGDTALTLAREAGKSEVVQLLR